MINIKRAYPVLDGIKTLTLKAVNYNSLSGRQFPITIKDYPGWLDVLIISFNRSDVDLRLRRDESEWEYSPADLYNDGRSQPDGTGFWLSEYDDKNDRYTIIFSKPDMLGFRDKLEVETYCSATYNIKEYRAELYQIFDIQKFKESVKKWSF